MSASVNTTGTLALIPPITNPVFTEDFEEFMPLGLLALASNLRIGGYEPFIYQPNFSLFGLNSYAQAAECILALSDQAVGFSTWCHSYPSSILLAKEIKKRSPSTAIIFGGPQATILDTETLGSFPFVDFVLRGEADFTFVTLMDALRKSGSDYSSIPALTYRQGGAVVSTPAASYLADLNQLPIPAYDMIDLNAGCVSLDVGRGCPFKCTFCTTNDFFSKSYRVKSAKRIIAEMDYIYENFGINNFDFTHDMFTLNKRFLMPFFDDLVSHQGKTGRKYTWTCSARLDCVSDDVLYGMARAGCTGIFFGVESGSQRIQKIIKKNIRLARGYDVVDSCRRHGIRSTSAFIAGFPEEARSDVDETMFAMFEMMARGAKPQMSLLSLLPQTPLYERNKSKLVFDGHFSDFSGASIAREEFALIRERPDLFSSFYYLPVDSASRSTLVSLSCFVNHLQSFRNTIELLWPTLKVDLQIGSFIDFFEKKLRTYARYVNKEVVGIIKTLGSYIRMNVSPGLVPAAESIFIAEAAIAVARRKFVTWQVLNPRKEPQEQEGVIPGDARIKFNPYFELVKTPEDIRLANEALSGNYKEHCCGDEERRFHYLAIALNERNGALYQIEESEVLLIEALLPLEGRTLDEMVHSLPSPAEQAKVHRVLMRLHHLSIVNFDQHFYSNAVQAAE